jgi:rhomboid family protein
MGRRPVLAVAVLVGLNVAVFAGELALGSGALDEALNAWGLVPRELLRGGGLRVFATPMTSMFLHASGVHLAVNLAFLVVFGRGLEARLGAARLAVLYLGSGLVAAAAQVASAPAAFVPALGASGAVSGLLGAQARLAPGARVAGVPAVAGILLWLVIQLLSTAWPGPEAVSGTAGWAHWGGFVAGFAGAPLLRNGARGLTARSRSGSETAQLP